MARSMVHAERVLAARSRRGGFLILHILVAVTLMPASAGTPMTPEQEVLSRLCD